MTADQITDAALQTAVRDELRSYCSRREEGIAIVETAGGVLSPAPSGTSQADVYAHLLTITTVIPTVILLISQLTNIFWEEDETILEASPDEISG